MANEFIIVVDDDTSNVNLLKMLLELDGFQVDACETIEEALASATPQTRAFIIDCYLSRGSSGLDLLEAIRSANTAAPPQSIVIMTSGDHRLEDQALEKGADVFMLKPYSPSALSSELNTIFNQGTPNG